MILQLEAAAIEIEQTEFDVLAIGFYAEENYLMIQQSLDAENADYHIERDDQSFGGYGGVEKIELSQNSIEVVLDETGKENLQCEGLEIGLEIDDKNYELLIEKLKSVFGNALIVK